MKYLVLGSSGQVGNALVKYLRKKGKEVITFDIADKPEQDLRIKDILNDLIVDVDFVFFLAFDVGGSKYLKKNQLSYSFLHNNILLQAHTFEVLKSYNKKFIYASSQMSNMGFSPYGICKSVGELYTKTLGGITVKF
ncbi:NAD(P)-dependent oxidoreductase [bacterium]|nr:NAD(P)-dependent oxidoreductase [bacterium]